MCESADDPAVHRGVSGELVRLRPVRDHDLPQIVAWENDYDTTRYLGGPLGTTVEGERRRMLTDRQDGGPTTWAVETRTEGRLVGVVTLHNMNRRHHRARVFLIIGRIADRGRGFGADTLRCLLHHCFTQGGWHRISMRVLPENHAMVRCALKCGFEREGTSREAWFIDGQFNDDIRFSILEQDWRGTLHEGDR